MLRVTRNVSDWEFQFKIETIKEEFVLSEMINNHCDGKIAIIIKTHNYNNELIEKLKNNEVVDIIRKISVRTQDDNGNVTDEIMEFTYPNFVLKNVIVQSDIDSFTGVIFKLLNY